MTITIGQVQGKDSVTRLSIDGDLDASNYKDVIAKANEAYETGSRCLIIDMSNLDFMASSGLVALHSVALLMQGEQPPDPEYGWEAFHDIGRDPQKNKPACVKLYNPQPRVKSTLEKTGFSEIFEIYSDLDTAIASFG